MKIYVTRRIPEAGFDCLQKAGLNWRGGTREAPPTRAELLEEVTGAEGLLSLLTERIDEEVMERAPGLRVIANMAVGFDNVDVAEATRRGILVCNTPGVLTETTADFTWALMMAAARRIPEGDRYVREGRFTAWGPLLMLGRDLWGSTLGIVGFGRIGRAVSRRAAGFGMEILFSSPSGAEESFEGSQRCRLVPLEQLLERSDFVSLHCPLNPETRHLIGREALARMKPTAILINTSRGPVVDEGALVEALREGRPAGVALDVFEDEPNLAPGLAELPNVVLAPHAASASHRTRGRMAEMAAANLVAGLSGERPAYLVNPEVLRR